MQTTRYLIVGGGMTGAEAAKAVRERDPEAVVTLVGSEPHSGSRSRTADRKSTRLNSSHT